MFSIEEKIKFIEKNFGISTGYRGNAKDIAVKCPICNPLGDKKKLSIRISECIISILINLLGIILQIFSHRKSCQYLNILPN